MSIQYGDNEYIKLFRKMINWEWYTDINTKVLFLHLLLKANWKDGNWQGIKYKRGQLIASIDTLATETGLTYEQTRTAIKHLKSTGEITYTKIAKGGLFTIVEYGRFQDVPTRITHVSHEKPQIEPTQNPHDSQQYKNNKEDKEVKKESSRFAPPSLEDVRAYCSERNNSVDPQRFIDFYESKGWMVGKNKMKDWKAAIRTWEQRDNGKNKKEDDIDARQRENYGSHWTDHIFDT